MKAAQPSPSPAIDVSDMRKLIRVLKGQSETVPPIWMMRQAGRYLPEYREVRKQAGSFLDLCYSPELACEVTLQPIRRYGFDASIVFADILLVPDALGQDVAFKEGEGPVLDPVDGQSAFGKLSDRNLHDHLAPVYETVSRVREGLPSETALIGFCGAPWTVATYMVGGRGSPDQKAARMAGYSREKWFEDLIALLTEASAQYLCRQIEAGADCVQVFDSWAGNLAPIEFDHWCIGPTKRLVELVKEVHPDVPIIGFPKGCGPSYRDFAPRTGVDAVSFDTAVDPFWIAEISRERSVLGKPQFAVQGNLDPLAVIAGGAVLDEAVDRIMDALSEAPFVFNLGHGLVPETPPDNVQRVIDRVRSYSDGGSTQ